MTIRENIQRFAKEEKLKFGEIIIKTIYLIGKVKQTPVTNFGINIHRANTDPEDIATKVDWHSAGCQVIANINDFNRMMGLAINSKKTFTYTIFTT